MKTKRPYLPACVIAILVAGAFGLFNLCQLYLLKDSYPVSKMQVGGDYTVFFAGTEALMTGVDTQTHGYWYRPETLMQGLTPYAAYGYWFPPVAAYLNYPLWLLGLETARQCMFFILIVAVICSYGLINSSFLNIEKKHRATILMCGVITVLLSYPFYFLIVRGHFLGIVILIFAMGIYLYTKNNPVCGVCFGLSIGIFIFPVLILAPLLIFRRYKILLYTLATLILLFLCCPEQWLYFLKKIVLLRVATRDVMPENCSMANTFHYFAIFLERILSMTGCKVSIGFFNQASFAAYILMFFAMMLSDYAVKIKHGMLDIHTETALALMYVPFMIAVPKITVQYNLVMLLLLIPALCSLVQTLKKSPPQPVLWLLTGGIALSQIQAHAFQELLNCNYFLFHFFPAFGLFLVMIGCLAFKVWLWQADTDRVLSAPVRQ
jgi:Glycosyltransferase family 87